jgi:hypothetical protein
MELPFYIQVDAAASPSSNQYLTTYRKMTLKKLYFVADASIAAHASNHCKIDIYNGSTKIALRHFDSSGGSSITGGVSELLALSGGEALDFSDLGELKIEYTQSGSGMAIRGGLVAVFEPRREV